MTLPHLLLVPDADSYDQAEGAEVVAVALGSGASLSRRDKVNAVRHVSVRWSMGQDGYRYFRAFYNTAIKKGTLPFTCDLLSEDGGGAVAQQCSFVPGSLSMPSQVGKTFVQSATLEVKPLPVDADLDESVISIYESGTNAAVLLDLEHLVLVKMPETIGA
jgi:hypothetical protein